jgi:hypothetical protein
MLHSAKHYWAARAEKQMPGRRECPSRFRPGLDIMAVLRRSKGPRVGFGPFTPDRPLTRYSAGYRAKRM